MIHIGAFWKAPADADIQSAPFSEERCKAVPHGPRLGGLHRNRAHLHESSRVRLVDPVLAFTQVPLTGAFDERRSEIHR